MDYESLIIRCKEIKAEIADCMKELIKYKKPGISVDEWRFGIDNYKYRDIFKRYYARKNWPFGSGKK